MRFAFLVMDEHPYGRQMLLALLEANLIPALIIEERSEVATEEREKFLVRIAKQPLPPTFETLLQDRDIARVFVSNHNSEACEAHLRQLSPELIVLGGTRIIKPYIFQKAARCINAHPGLLPEVRGSASVAWAIHLDLPIGCTTHLIDAGIDTGAIITRRQLEVKRSDTYESLCQRTIALSAELMALAVQAYASGALKTTPQPAGQKALKNMPDAQVEEVKRKLAEGRYAHFAD